MPHRRPSLIDLSATGDETLYLTFFFCPPPPPSIGQKISWLADRHLVVFVGEQEVCRGGVPAPAPPTEGSSWAYDLWSLEAADGAPGGGDAGKGRSGRGGGTIEVKNGVYVLEVRRFLRAMDGVTWLVEAF